MKRKLLVGILVLVVLMMTGIVCAQAEVSLTLGQEASGAVQGYIETPIFSFVPTESGYYLFETRTLDRYSEGNIVLLDESGNTLAYRQYWDYSNPGNLCYSLQANQKYLLAVSTISGAGEEQIKAKVSKYTDRIWASQDQVLYGVIGSRVEMNADAFSIQGVPLSYRWYYLDGINRTELPSKRKDYTIPFLTESGEYLCEITDGTETKEIRFQIEADDPDFSAVPVDNTYPFIPSSNSEAITLEVNAKCSTGSLSYQWYRVVWGEIGGIWQDTRTELEGETEASYTAHGPYTQDCEYMCEVSNYRGDKKQFQRQVWFGVNRYCEEGFKAVGGTRIEKVPGENAELKVKVNEGATLSWYHYTEGQYVLIPDESGTTLTVSDDTEKYGEYQCRATRGSDVSAIEFTVELKDGLTVKPKDDRYTIYIANDEKAELEVEAETAIGNLTYQWYKQEEIPLVGCQVTTIINGATGATYKETKTEYNTTCHYRCVVSNGIRTWTISITVIHGAYGPGSGFRVAANTASRFTVTKGEDVTMGVMLYNAQGDTGYQWLQKQGDGLVPINGGTEASFTAENIQESTDYCCQAHDEYNTGITGFHIDVATQTDLQATGTPEDTITATPGQEIDLEVTAEGGDGEIHYTWYEKAYNADKSASQAAKIAGVTGNQYSTTADKQAEYACVVSDSSAYVLVPFTVNLDSGLTAEAVGSTTRNTAPHERVTMKVNASSSLGLDISYEWVREWKSSNSPGYQESVIEGAETDTLTIDEPIGGDIYTCKVSDGYTCIPVEFYIIVDNQFQVTAVGGNYHDIAPGGRTELKVKATCLDDSQITYEWRYSSPSSEILSDSDTLIVDYGTNLNCDYSWYYVYVRDGISGETRVFNFQVRINEEMAAEEGFTISVSGATLQEGTTDHYSVNAGEAYIITVSLPENATTFNLLSAYGGWDSVAYTAEAGEQGIQNTVNINEEDRPLRARYADSEGEWHYSNTLYITYICTHNSSSYISYQWNYDHQCTADNAQTHTHTGTGKKVRICNQCGQVIEDLGDAETPVQEEHEYYNGHCYVCDYTCQHGRMEEAAQAVTYESCDQQYHYRYENRGGISIQCPDCDYSQYYPENRTTEAHTDTDGNGVCDRCGYDMSGEWNWEIEGGTLVFTGFGAIPDFTNAVPAPWCVRADEIRRIMLPAGITGIGANAFAGFGTKEIRVDFNHDKLPENIAPDAFARTKAVCRFFTEDESWPGKNDSTHQYGGTLKWIYLPTNELNGNESDTGKNVLSFNYTSSGWAINVEDEQGYRWIPMTAEQVNEAAFDRHKGIGFNRIPTTAEDQSVYAGWDDVSHISIEYECAANLDVELKADSVLKYVRIQDSDSTLNITDPREDGLYNIYVSNGSLTYTGNVQTLRLSDSDETSQEVTINGNVDTLTFYDNSTVNRYKGSLTVSGIIRKGHVIGNGTLNIPGVGEKNIENLTKSTFENAQQTEKIIENGVLNIAGVTPITLTIDMFTYDYWLNKTDGQRTISLLLYPKEEYKDIIGMDNAVHCDDLDIQLSDIVWGKETTVSVWADEEDGFIALNGGTDNEGHMIGLGRVVLRRGKVRVNCPVESVNIFNTRSEPEGANLEINAPVGFIMLEELKDGTINLGEGGSIREGIWLRKNFADRRFGPVTAQGVVYSPGNLRAMSWKDGDLIHAELPSDDVVTAAAGLSGNNRATADISDSSANDLTDEENAALTAFLAKKETGVLVSVFEATVTSYTEYEDGSVSAGSEITSLNSNISFKVNNSTGDACYIVRLHEEEGVMTATQITEPTNNDAIPFESNLFSKYVIVASNWEAAEEWPDWELNRTSSYDWVLHVYGEGQIPSYSNALQASWSSAVADKENIRIVVDEGITGIGSNAFGNMKGTVRVDFLGTNMPEIDENTFAGTTAVCRYYQNNASWTSGTTGRTDATWIYLPYYDEEDSICDIYFNDGWYITPRSSEGYIHVNVTAAQAQEYTHKRRDIHFDTLPTNAEDLALVNSDNVIMFYFSQECSGSLDVTLSETSRFNSLDMYAPNVSITIHDPRPESIGGRVSVNEGTLDYQGHISELLLEASYDSEGHVTVTGNVETLNYYDTTSNRAYHGDLTVTGTIKNGTIYGAKTISIPGIGDAISFGGMVKNTFSNIQQNQPIILNDALNLTEENQAKLVSTGELSIDQFDYMYQFLDSRVFFELYPKNSELAQYSATIEDIYDYNPDFTTDDVIYGNGTKVYVGSQDNTTLVFNGAIVDGRKVGLGEVSIAPACNVVLNCPVDNVIASHFRWSTGAINLQINDKVKYCALNINQGPGTIISLGNNGSVLAGDWDRTLKGYRFFGRINGPYELFNNEKLNVLSGKAGQEIRAILPSDATVTAAAGQDATIDLNETSIDELSNGESQALNDFLTAQGGGTVASVFDISVTGVIVDSDGSVHAGNEITTVSTALQLTVSNESNGEAYIVRLHENGDGTISADQLCDATAASTLSFGSNLFSKYVMIMADKPIDPSTLATLTLPTGLTSIEANAFEGGAFEAVIIPDGCLSIGAEAFKDCKNLVYISYPSGIQIEDSAFDGCTIRKSTVR